MISPEGEEILFPRLIQPAGKSVEVWMLELEELMKVAVKRVMNLAIADYSVTKRPTWMQKWPGMVVLNGSQVDLVIAY